MRLVTFYYVFSDVPPALGCLGGRRGGEVSEFESNLQILPGSVARDPCGLKSAESPVQYNMQ